MKSEIANYQNSVSSGNDELTSIGFEGKIVNAAVQKYSPSELPQKKGQIFVDNKVLTTVRLGPYRVLYRPMLVTLSSWKTKTTSYISIRRELWEGRGAPRGAVYCGIPKLTGGKCNLDDETDEIFFPPYESQIFTC